MRCLGKTCTLAAAGALALAMCPAVPMGDEATCSQEAYASEETASEGSTRDIGQLNMVSRSLYTHVMIATYKTVGGVPIMSYWSKQKSVKVH